MKGKALWCISVRATPESELEVRGILETQLKSAPVIFSKPGAGLSTVSVFLQDRRCWTPARRARIRGAIRALARADLPIHPPRVTLRKIAARDWSESWKRHFRPVEINERLLVVPSWSRRRPKPGQKVIVINPEMAFGTGQHPTTCYCLRQIAVPQPEDHAAPVSFLDLGTGSGILSIAAARLGCSPVWAIDSDPQAIITATSNAHRNQVAHRITFKCLDVLKLSVVVRRTFDLICANLTRETVIKAQSRISRCLKVHGRLVVAGILREEFSALLALYRKQGFRLAASHVDGEWKSAVLIQQNGGPTCSGRG